MNTYRKMATYERSIAQKAFFALGACAVAGVAAIQIKRVVDQWRKEHLDFDFPFEDQLFIGWGGGDPKSQKYTS